MKILVDNSETKEKYKQYEESIVPWFVDMMKKYDDRISFYMKNYKELCSKNRAGSFSEEIEALTESCKREKIELTKGHIGENIYITPYDLYPTRFHYFNLGCSLKFIMKSEKKAVVIINLNDVETWHKFEFRPSKGHWILDKMYLGYASEKGPYKVMEL